MKIYLDVVIIGIGVILCLGFSIYYFLRLRFDTKVSKYMIKKINCDIDFYVEIYNKSESKRQKNHCKKLIKNLKITRKLINDIYS